MELGPDTSRPRVLFIASEAYPLAKTGGLADVCGALPVMLASLGVDVRLMLPGYPEALERARNKRTIALDMAEGRLVAATMPGSDLGVLLYDCPSLFARRGGLYRDDDGQDWPDNDRRFAMFCRAAASVALGRSALEWQPDLVHAHDWHAGLVPALLRYSGGKQPKSVFTVHNLAFQGNFPLGAFAGLGLPGEALSPDGVEFYNHVSFMKAGLRFADRLTTVSPTYAREILTAEHGCGFEGLLRTRARDLVGILNGIDDVVWDPANDVELPSRYSAADPAGKAACKRALQQEMGLESRDAPLLIFVNRLTHQKMADVVLNAVPCLIADGGQVVVHGEGDHEIERGLVSLAHACPGQVAVRVGYAEPLAHRLHAAADLSLTPSRFEPCGLTTMYAMRYGALPVTRPVGGLKDTVDDAGSHDDDAAEGSGFMFSETTADGLTQCVRRATRWYGEPMAWEALRRRAMRRNFGWERSARQYCALYADLLGSTEPPIAVAAE
ncbi:MAG TPA: glycogen synthase GlgA [Stellaceae bacterium]|nr:glycogen synthase GlgA [Stellaceae bacterium]